MTGSARARYVRVAVNSGRPSLMTFTYRVPPGREVQPGEVVHVPWGARTLQGVVTDGPTDLPGYAGETRELEPPVEGAARIDPARLELGAWLAEYYLAPPWDAVALMLPPGAGEAPRTALARGGAAPAEALSERQQRLYDLLSENPTPVEDLREVIGARGFDAAMNALVRRGLAERRYSLTRPRGRARVVDIVRLAVDADAARAYTGSITGRRASRRGRALQALLDVAGPRPFDEVARIARGAPAVETLIAEGALAREGSDVRLVIDRDEAERMVRSLTRTRAESAAAALLEALAAGPEERIPVTELARRFGDGAREGLEALRAAGVVAVEEELQRRDPLRNVLVAERGAAELVAEQREAAAAVRAAIDRADGTRILLQGVTGSGKTEVYLDALRHAVERGKRGLVLVPEIALTPQTVRRFLERFPGRVGVLHSGLSLGEAHDEWHATARGDYDVVIGSRSAVFAPQPDLGLIVVDEAHEWTFKQSEPSPRYDARTVAARLGELAGAAVVYGTATPDAEQWFAAAEGDMLRLDLPRRLRPVPQPGGGTWLWPAEELPEIEVVDVRGARSLFSEELLRALGETLDRDEQAILFLNRRGLFGHLLCPNGHTPLCPSCDVSLSLHDPPDRLVCHQCNRSRPLQSRCRECGGALRPARAGTQRVEQEVRRLFPAARVERWDRDSVRTAEQHEAILGRFMRHEADVLVGTQMVAKGLDLPLVTLVGVVMADYSLWAGGFRAREHTFQLLSQVAGRAGRADRLGRVIIQTLSPDDRAIEAAAANDVDGFFEDELPWRREHRYPPFVRLVRLQFAHARQEYALEEAARVRQELRRLAAGLPDIDVLGPTPPQVARVRGRYRWGLLLKGIDPAALVRQIELPPGWVVDVDPAAVT
ncbi:MAG: primosomal protein N' [Dehalococcoidia bacterium]